jgi:hypothetical protein
MSEVAEHFVYLGIEARAVAGTKLLSREVGQRVPAGEILAALDSDGQKHLLIPVAYPDVAEDHSSQGVLLGERELLVSGRSVCYADLHCRIPALDLVFERLLDDVLARVQYDPTAPVEACRSALDDWRALLRTASEGISRDTVVGLVGELEVVRLLGAGSPAAALDAWRGPTRSVHDFVLGEAELEVKATASVDGGTISISSLDQLDPTLVGELHLVVVHVKPDETAPTLDERIDQLIALGLPRNGLLTRVQKAGYVYETAPGIDDRYSVRSIRAWRIGSDFPGLRVGDIAETRRRGISDVKYKLSLAAAPDRLTDEDLANLMRRWTRPRT